MPRRLARTATLLAAAALAGAGLAGCAEDIGRDGYSPYVAGAAARVDEGVVITAEPGAAPGGYRYTIRLADGGRIIQAPQADPAPIPDGTRVYVSYGQGRARVRPIAGYVPPPAG